VILVTGATGKVGRELVDLLLADGQEVGGITRNRATAALPGGVNVVVGDPSQPKTLASSLRGVESLFLNPGTLGDAAAELLSLAVEQRVQRVVLLSAVTVEYGGGYRTILEMITSVDVHYEMEPGEAQRHPLLGHWAPDLALVTPAGKTRVPRLRHRGRGVLLDLADRAALRDAATGRTDRVDVVAARCEGPPPADALLIRPDGYVAWDASAHEAVDDSVRRLRRALTTWFGPESAPPGGT